MGKVRELRLIMEKTRLSIYQANSAENLPLLLALSRNHIKVALFLIIHCWEGDEENVKKQNGNRQNSLLSRLFCYQEK